MINFMKQWFDTKILYVLNLGNTYVYGIKMNMLTVEPRTGLC